MRPPDEVLDYTTRVLKTNSILLQIITDITKHNILLVVGDFNAHVGKESAKYAFHNETNSNGEHLVNLIQETKHIISKGKLAKMDIHF